MAQYWLQTPIENAKEVVQRFIDDNAGTLTGLAGKTVSYIGTTEVIYYNSQIPSSPVNNDEILFGTWYLASDENTLVALIDGGGSITTFDTTIIVKNGTYPYIIWNKLNGTPTMPSYFVGYKFSVL